mmetsp:Transcript_14531/g.25481  ORF Transcript_14531/g.25481 Transcript_14531/m.25481 type:complete len:725 (-) Transcript_14531:171-2345(-)
MVRFVCLATCNLNQWALDFEGNLKRIVESIKIAKEKGSTYRVGPELEIPGYGCEDHFLELDTVTHSWEALASLIESGVTKDILCDVGMPVIHRGVMYNCRVLIYGNNVLLIRPKLHLANDGNYREPRYFATWKREGEAEPHALPANLVAVCGGQRETTFGDAVLCADDALIAPETCEELFTPRAPHIDLALQGVEVISNGSGSHHQLRKLSQRLDLIKNATAKAGGVYLYANQRGCDGGRLYYDGCACIAVNGEIVAQGAQFGLKDVEVVTATVDLDQVVSYRCAVSSLREQASCTTKPRPQVRISPPFSLTSPSPFTSPAAAAAVALAASAVEGSAQPIKPYVPLPEEEIAYGPASWLWDYLRRSGGSGYLVPLSGGADSAATAAIVAAMCQLVVEAVAAGDVQVAADMRRIGNYGTDEVLDSDPKQFANRIFVTLYMGTVNSSAETRRRSESLAGEIGAYHLSFAIDSVVSAIVSLFQVVTGKLPRFRAHGGSGAENLALQNIQARCRMVLAFLMAQLVNWCRGRPGFLLVLGSANVDECLRGYLTKYDCSSADINPIGAISKEDLRRFLVWGSKALGLPSLMSVVEAEPTAELEPFEEGRKPQNDEDDMGVSYPDLSIFGRLRKIQRLGPVGMARHCIALWKDRMSPSAAAAKVKHFFTYYAINRHKATVITPAYHAESYSPDDNRFDHRPFLYNVRWPWQYKQIDQIAAEAEARLAKDKL